MTFSEYNSFAWIYNKYWGDAFTRPILKFLQTSALGKIPRRGTILDLCCGTGQLARALSLKGYRVIGIDGSEQMLRFAKKNAPSCTFRLADARNFTLDRRVDLAISAFDSLNHVMGPRELKRVFDNVHATIKERGLFVFDLNMKKGFKARWRGSFGIVGDDHACIIRSKYDPKKMIGEMDIAMFFREMKSWSRSDLILLERCYEESQVRSALREAGFDGIVSRDSQRDMKMREVGRKFFVCRKGAQ